MCAAAAPAADDGRFSGLIMVGGPDTGAPAECPPPRTTAKFVSADFVTSSVAGPPPPPRAAAPPVPM